MFIQTEATPNPNVLKFLPGRMVAPGAPCEFLSIDQATASPLAEALFQLEDVTGVFFGDAGGEFAGQFVVAGDGAQAARHDAFAIAVLQCHCGFKAQLAARGVGGFRDIEIRQCFRDRQHC